MSFRLPCLLVLGALLTPLHGQTPLPPPRPVDPPPEIVPPPPPPPPALPPRDAVLNRMRITTLAPIPLPAMRDQVMGRMRITTIQPPCPPPVAPGPVGVPPVVAPGGPQPGLPVLPGQVLPLKGFDALKGVGTCPGKLCGCKWKCGRSINDDCGRRWLLVYGSPDWSHPAVVPGVLLVAGGQAPVFWTSTGQLFRLMP